MDITFCCCDVSVGHDLEFVICFIIQHNLSVDLLGFASTLIPV